MEEQTAGFRLQATELRIEVEGCVQVLSRIGLSQAVGFRTYGTVNVQKFRV